MSETNNITGAPTSARGVGGRLKGALKALQGNAPAPHAPASAPALPLSGHGSSADDTRLSIPFVDDLSDGDLELLNAILPWSCFVADAKGRRFGNPASNNKRTSPQMIPAPRIVRMDEYFGLADKHVVEFGCFEGIHTVALLQRARRVTAIDSRLENVIKTIVRCACFDMMPTARVADIDGDFENEALRADLGHHVGVLYHLADPVAHLLSLGRHLSVGLMLDTHYALPELATESYETQGRTWKYQRYNEGGREDVFSGMNDHSKWLSIETLTEVLQLAGFDEVEVFQTQEQTNGARLTLMARRTGQK